MAAPQLVIADAPFKKYPGGVIVLRAADWLAGARGTLSTEADARSCCGTVVRDTQKVTTSIYATEILGNYAAFQEAEDTLVVDLATLPIEPGVAYSLLVSLLIEGDWDSTNTDTLRGGDQEQFNAACNFEMYGAGTGRFTSDSDVGALVFMPRGIDSYRIVSWPSPTLQADDVDGDEILYFRAYAQNGTTIEWLIDQIYFVPTPFNQGGGNSSWVNNDFAIVPGSANTFGSYSLSNGDYVDGDDGGDDQGEFTWHPLNFWNQTAVTGDPGGGDYQRKADSSGAEYMARVIPNDFYFLENSTKSFPVNEPSSSHCYGLHGPFFIPQQTWINDAFNRTVGDGNWAGADNHFNPFTWGLTPEGFGWRSRLGDGPHATGLNAGLGNVAWVDGSEGMAEVRAGGIGGDPGVIQCALYPYPTFTVGTSLGANLVADNLNISGSFRLELTAGTLAGHTVFLNMGSGLSATHSQALLINLDLLTGDWYLTYGGFSTTLFPSSANNLIGPVGMAGGYTQGDTVNFKLQIRRYNARVKVWTGSEPGTWDYDDFRPLTKTPGGFKAYPYLTTGQEDLNWSIEESDNHSFLLSYSADTDVTDHAQFHIESLVVDYDPLGNNESAFASIEQPESTEIGSIEMPAGCQHLVYWGSRDWTTFVGGDGPYVEFSAKTWNDSTAAEFQRSEAIWWWFRSGHLDLIPMNWRSADRSGHPWRVLSG